MAYISKTTSLTVHPVLMIEMDPLDNAKSGSNYDCSFAGLLQLQMILKNCLFTCMLMLMVKRKSVPLALF